MSHSESTTTPHVSSLRVNYSAHGLRDEDVIGLNPVDLFERWLQDAVQEGEIEPNAMCLATVDEQSRPSARMVLLKDVDHRGFVWYTNYGSRKACEVTRNPAAALNFWWPKLERAVRVQGDVQRTSPEESTQYFNSRPVKSRLGAIVSQQSRPIDAREQLETRMQALETEYLDNFDASKPVKDIVRPETWGGFRLVPTQIEFWKGRPSRLHDRILYTRQSPGNSWTHQRLQP